MKKARIVLLIPMLLLGSLLTPALIQQVHAATGSVCLADPSASPCPSSPPVLSGPVGQLIRVGVFISGSDGLNAFDITLLANHTFVKPFGVDFTGSVLLGTPVVVLECLGGALVSGSVCSAPTCTGSVCTGGDTPDTLHLAATNALGTGLTTAPTTGLLFTAIYSITGTTGPSSTSIGFQTSCSQASVSGGTCVTVVNGGASPDVETVQAATFNNSASSTMADVVVSSNLLSFGPEFPSTANTATITATAKNGYPGLATDSVAFTAKSGSGITATFSPVSCATAGTSCSVALSLSAPNPGTFPVTVFGTYSTLDAAGNPDTLSSTITITVTVNDFGFTVTPTTVTFHAGTTGTANVTITSVNGFAGNVTLTSQVIGSLTVSFSLNPIFIAMGGSAASVAVFSSSTVATDHAIIRAASQGRTKASPTMAVLVTSGSDFSLSATPSSVQVAAGGNGTSTITVKAVAGFTGTVSLFAFVSSPGLGCSLTPASVGLGSQGNSTLSCSGGGGSYVVTVKGDNGTQTHFVFVSFTVQGGSPDFLIGANPTAVVVPTGTNGASVISVTSVNGFSGTVTFTVAIQGSPTMGCSVNPNILFGPGSATLSCLDTIPSNANNVTVTGMSGTLSHSVIVVYTVTNAPNFSISADPSAVSLKPGVSGISMITITPIGGFNATVAFTITVPIGLTCTLGTFTMNPPYGATPLNCSGSAGSYSVVVSGKGGMIVHSVAVNFTVSSGGLVCIAQSGSNDCPISPPVLTGPPPPTTQQLRVAVVISNSGGLNAFDISLLTNHTLLKPAGVDLNGTILTNPNVIAECIGGVGARCLSTDNADTLHVALAIQGLLIAPKTGLLFTAIYNITGTTVGTTIGYQTGCTASSVAGTTTCVAVADGSLTPVPENVQSASFSDIPTFTMMAQPVSVTLQLGTSATSVITMTSINGFSDTISLSTFSPAPGLSASLSLSGVVIRPSGSNTTVLTVGALSSTIAGTYSVRVTGTSGSQIQSVFVQVVIAQQDFTINASPGIISLNAGTSSSSTLTITSVSSFSGTLQLTIPFILPGLTVSLNPSTINLTAGGSNSSTLVVAASSAASGSFSVTVTATSGAMTHSVAIGVNIEDFAIFPGKPSVTIQPGTPALNRIQVNSQNSFTGVVTLSTIAPTGLIATLDFPVLNLPPNSNVYTNLNVTATTIAPGNYTVTVLGSSAGITRSARVSVIVIGLPPPPSPDFNIVVTPFSSAVGAGDSVDFVVTLTSLNGFSGNVSLSASVFQTGPNLPVPVVSPSLVSLPSGAIRIATLTVSTSNATTPLLYGITTTAVSGSIVHAAVITLQVTPPPDESPVARFTVSPQNPIVGETVSFDGSASSDPDGSIQLWIWDFGDGSGFGTSSPNAFHTYFNTGSYNVQLTVRDSSFLSASVNMTIVVMPRPQHDVAIVQLQAFPTKAVSTQIVAIALELENTGISNETVSVTAFAGGRPVQTISGIFLQGCPNQFGYCNPYSYFTIDWDTTGVLPGNYTISASVSLPPGEFDPTPSDNSAVDGVVTVLPAPVLTINPASGLAGTKVVVHGSGFPVLFSPYGPQFDYILISFDDNQLAFTLTQTGAFNVTIDVPLAQAGMHQIKALDEYSLSHASATFTVTPTTTGSLVVSIDTGAVYFPGDTAVIYVLANLNGVPDSSNSLQLQLILFKPDGSNSTLKATSIGSGLFKATYSVSSTGSLGTYAILAKAHESGPLDASALRSFEVKPTWLNSNGKNVATVATVAGLLGLVGVAWKKGYLRRKNGDPAQLFD